MTVKITLARLAEITASLKKLLQTDLPVKTAYRLSKLAAKVAAEEKHLADIRIRLYKTLGEERVVGSDRFTIPESKLAEYNRQAEALLTEEIELDVAQVKLEDIEAAKLSALDMAHLDFVIEQPAE